jgi:hypothetical protein
MEEQIFYVRNFIKDDEASTTLQGKIEVPLVNLKVGDFLQVRIALPI